MRFFEQQGIFATRQQWKTQITLWQIGKNNLESDMSFAKAKAENRRAILNKDTEFIIKGQRKTIRDIEKYFKRKQRVVYPGRPQTPENLVYYTPLPSPELHHSLPSEFANDSIWDQADQVFYNLPGASSDPALTCNQTSAIEQHSISRSAASAFVKGLWQQTQNIPIALSSPADFRNTEICLAAIETYYLSSFIHSCGPEKAKAAVRFLDSVISATANLNANNVGTAQFYWSKAIGSFQFVELNFNPTFLTHLMQCVILLCMNGYCEFAQQMLRMVILLAQRKRPESDTILVIARAFNQTTNLEHLTNAGLLLANERAVENLSINHLQRSLLQQAVIAMHCAFRDWETALACSQYSVDSLQLHDVNETVSNDHSSWDFLRHARILMKCYRYEDADFLLRRVQSMFERQIPNPQIHFCFLLVRGELRSRAGLPGAIDDLQNALTLARAEFSTGDHRTIVNARILQFALSVESNNSD